MDKVVKAQIYTTVILATVFATLFSYVTLAKYDSISSTQQIFIMGAVTAIAPFLFYFIAKRGQQKMFGDYMQMLRKHLKELGSEENHNRNNGNITE